MSGGTVTVEQWAGPGRGGEGRPEEGMVTGTRLPRHPVSGAGQRLLGKLSAGRGQRAGSSRSSRPWGRDTEGPAVGGGEEPWGGA